MRKFAPPHLQVITNPSGLKYTDVLIGPKDAALVEAGKLVGVDVEVTIADQVLILSYEGTLTIHVTHNRLSLTSMCERVREGVQC